MDRSARVLLITVGVLLGGVRMAAAAHLEKINSQVNKEVSPQAATDATDPCFGEADTTITADVLAAEFLVDVREHTAVRAANDSCNLTESNNVSILVTFMIMPDGAEQIGTPVEFCVDANQALFAQASGAATAETQLGGNPITDPETLVRSPGNVTLVSVGPFNLVNSGQQVGNERRTVTALIGDTVTFNESVNTSSAVMNAVGDASADATTHIRFSVGPCAAQGAPVASRGGLATLAAALAGIGVVVLRRRQVTRGSC